MTEKIGLQAVLETNEFQSGLTIYTNGLRVINVQTDQAAGKSSQAGSIITTALGTAFGFLAAQAIPAAIGAVKDFIASGIEAVGEIQNLRISLETLSAQELVSAGVAKDFKDGLAQAGPVASYLMEQIKQLSLVSPFEYSDIINTFRLNQSFGQTAETALQLTQAITDMAAAGGRTGVFLERIAYNFSQMALVGKVTARDVRDLAMAGVDLSRVLREQLGMSIEEVNEALSSGSITMKDVTNAFIEFSSKNFAGAAERMSKTVSGLKSSFADLMFFAKENVLGPMLEAVTADLGGLFDSARGLVDSGVLRGIGEGLREVYNGLKNLIGVGAEAAKALSGTFQRALSGVLGDAYRWGSEIIRNLADGIIAGAANALIAAMNYVSSLLAHWLAPGSPPRVAPDIDKWGLAAMTEFLRGFTEADFRALNTVQRPLQDALNLLVQSGAISKQAGGQLFAGLSQAFSQALAGGGLAPDFFDRLTKAAGPYGAEIAKLAKMTLGLAEATEKVTQAEKDLDAARKREQAARQATNEAINEYNELLRAGADEETLKAKMMEINAADVLARQEGEAAKEAEGRLDVEQERLKLLQDQLSLQDQLLKNLLDIGRATLPEPVTDKGAGAGAGSGAGGGRGAAGAAAGAVAGIGASLSESMAGFLDKVKEYSDKTATDIAGSFKSKLGNVWNEIKANWTAQYGALIGSVKERWINFVNELQGYWQNFTAYLSEVFAPAKAELASQWESIKGTFQQAADIIRKSIEAIKETVGPSLEGIMETLKQMGIDWELVGKAAQLAARVLGTVVVGAILAVVVVIETVVGVIAGLVEGINQALKVVRTFSQMFTEGFKQVADGAAQFINAISDAFGALTRGEFMKSPEMFKKLGDAIVNIAQGLGKMITAIFAGHLGGVLAFIGGFVKGVIDYFKNLYKQLVGGSIIPDMMKAIQKVITNGLANVTATIKKWASNAVSAFSNAFKSILNSVTAGMKAVVNEIGKKLTEAANTIKGRAGDFGKAAAQVFEAFRSSAVSKLVETVNAVRAKITELVSSIRSRAAEFGSAAVQLMTSFKTSLISGLDQAKASLTQKITEMINAVKSKAGEMLSAGKDFIGGFLSGLQSRFSELVAAGLQAANRVIDTIKTKASDMFEAGKNLLGRFIDGIVTAAANAQTAVKNAIQNIINYIKSVISGAGSSGSSGSTPPASPKMQTLGDNIAEQMAGALADGLAQTQAAMLSALGGVMPKPAFAPVNQGGNTLNFNMGGVVINTPMDAAAFEHRVRQIIRSEYGG